MTTKIEWTDTTWNPIIGCSKISPGCQNCYAEKMAFRQTQMRPGCEYTQVIDPQTRHWNGQTAEVPSAWDKPRHWRKPRRIFVCSMGDLFHEHLNLRGELLLRVFRTMAAESQHTYQILTKRPDRMNRFVQENYGPAFFKEFPNVWLGVTAENQQTADERIPLLLKTPAVVRFVSCEPLLEEIDLWGARYKKPDGGKSGAVSSWKPALDWVIVGGESGPNARPMHPDWVRSLCGQCAAASVPFFFKQWGEWEEVSDHCVKYVFTQRDLASTGFLEMDGRFTMAHRLQYPPPETHCHEWECWMRRVGKKDAGHLLDGVEHHAFPTLSASAPPRASARNAGVSPAEGPTTP